MLNKQVHCATQSNTKEMLVGRISSIAFEKSRPNYLSHTQLLQKYDRVCVCVSSCNVTSSYKRMIESLSDLV